MVDSGIKVNGINETINKFNTKLEIVDLEVFKEKFKLDPGETGFYKLSLSFNTIYGESRIMSTYNRPPIGPLPLGTYCEKTGCHQEGSKDPSRPLIGDDHDMRCPRPENSSLGLTILGVNEEIVKRIDYNGDYKWVKEWAMGKKNFSRDDLKKLLIDEGMSIKDSEWEDVNGQKVLTFKYLLDTYPNEWTNIKYDPTLRGPSKIAPKTKTVNFLNNIIISYKIAESLRRPSGHKSSIRISKNGLINIINVPQNPEERTEMLDELVKRMNSLPIGTIKMKKFGEAAGIETVEKYSIIPEYSYAHSISGQFSLWDKKDKEVNFPELDRIISSFNSAGKTLPGKYSTVKLLNGREIITITSGDTSVKVIEWLYASGRLTRKGIVSKDYIKLVSIPVPGVKLTTLINKFGVCQLTLSKCQDTIISLGLCGKDDSAVISPRQFNDIYKVFNSIFEKEGDVLTIQTLKDTDEKPQKISNTSTGRAPDACRGVQKRYGFIEENESKRPIPYSWGSTCPYQYQHMIPQGLASKDKYGKKLYYPCCRMKFKKTEDSMRLYLIHGFPLPNHIRGGITEKEAKEYGIPPAGQEDLSSGIFPVGAEKVGAVALVNIPEEGGIQEVQVVTTKKSLSSNTYGVRQIFRGEDGKITKGDLLTIKGTDFVRESRRFRGLKSFTVEQLKSCISSILSRGPGKIIVNEEGEKVKYVEDVFNSRQDPKNTELFKKLLTKEHNIKMMSYTTFTKDFVEKSFVVKSVPMDSHHVYLVLSPIGNFYISAENKSFVSNINETFEETIILDGFMETPDSGETRYKYHAIDVLYYKNTEQTGENRDKILADIKYLYLSSVQDEELIFFPDEMVDIIDGSYRFINSDKNIMMIFMNSTKCCDYIVWDPLYKPGDEVLLRVFSMTPQKSPSNLIDIVFGFTGPDGVNTPLNIEWPNTSRDFSHTFTSKEIPLGLIQGDYVLLRVVMDSDGNVESGARQIIIKERYSVLGFEEYPYQDFEYTTELLSLIFRPVTADNVFEISNVEWITPSGRVLQYEPETNKLKEFSLA